MSRPPSPSSASAAQQTSYYRDAHGLPIEKPGPQIKIVYRGGEQEQHQGALTPVPAATSSSSGRTKSRAYQSGIAAGAEDVKYAAKYRDLKQKVREIEADNDRLVFKVLQAKRNIQRAKLERAILYERLGALPASPPQGNAPLPPQHAVQHVPSGGLVPRHQVDARPYGQSSRHQRSTVPPPPTAHHLRQHHQPPIQPAPPPAHVSPPQHHPQVPDGHPHRPARDTAHPGQLPITHAQQVTTIQTPDGPLLVVAGPDGRPVTTADGHYIPAQEIPHGPPGASGSHARKRAGGRVSKELREMREREAREMREREEIERKQQAMLASSVNNSGSGRASPPLPPALGGPQQNMPMSREREREWEIEREIRERERAQRREDHDNDRERSERQRDGHGRHRTHHHSGHGHGYHHRQQMSPPPPSISQSQELNLDQASPPPPPPPQAHRSHSQASRASQASYRSQHSYGHHHHVHSQSHSSSPHSPGSVNYPMTRMHNHQRIGPGSYVLRDRAAEDSGAVTPTAAASGTSTTQTTSPQNEEPPANLNAPGTGTGANSRVPTPPYMRRPSFNDAPVSGGAEDASNSVIKGETGNQGENGSGSSAQSMATPP